jgi:hypothetical protein
MSEMIERVARAINDARYDYKSDASWVPLLDDLTVARAAIEAMREPTKAMIRETYGLHEFDNDDMGVSKKDAAKNWKMMIDAALKETTDV